MEKNNKETVLQMTDGQLKDIIATMVVSVPKLTKEEAKRIIGNKGKFIDGLKKIFNQCVAEERPTYAVTVNVDGTEKKMEIVLFHFNMAINPEEVIALMDKEGFQPISQKALCALNEKYPDLSKEFPIVALGTVLEDDSGDKYVPCLYEYGEGRGWFNNWWMGKYRFAAVKK